MDLRNNGSRIMDEYLHLIFELIYQKRIILLKVLENREHYFILHIMSLSLILS